MFAGGERGGKYANINPRDLAHAVRSRAEGTYRAAGISHANKVKRISQIREDLYRFSLSASSDKLNFPRGWGLQKGQLNATSLRVLKRG